MSDVCKPFHSVLEEAAPAHDFRLLQSWQSICKRIRQLVAKGSRCWMTSIVVGVRAHVLGSCRQIENQTAALGTGDLTQTGTLNSGIVALPRAPRKDKVGQHCMRATSPKSSR